MKLLSALVISLSLYDAFAFDGLTLTKKAVIGIKAGDEMGNPIFNIAGPENIVVVQNSIMTQKMGTEIATVATAASPTSTTKPLTTSQIRNDLNQVSNTNDQIAVLPAVNVTEAGSLPPEIEITWWRAPVCKCDGTKILVDGEVECRKTSLKEVVESVQGAVIYVVGEHIITEPIKTKDNVTIVGVGCGPPGDSDHVLNQKPKLLASFVNAEKKKEKDSVVNGAIFLISDNWKGQSILLDNLFLSRDPNNDAYGMLVSATLHGDSFKSDVGQYLSLHITNSEVVNFRTKQRGGGAISLPYAKVLDFKNTKFENNVVEQLHKHNYAGGGGAIWVVGMLRGSKINIQNCIFNKNEHRFWHGVGGCMFVQYFGGLAKINGTFTHNSASDGGALNFQQMEEYAKIRINGTFDGNTAIPFDGFGTSANLARGAAIKIGEVRGSVSILGVYKNNWTGGRGGVVASTRWWGRSTHCYLGGTFINNTALESGAIWDNFQSNKKQPNGSTGSGNVCAGSTLRIFSGSYFQGNMARADERHKTKSKKASIFYAPSNDVEILEKDYMQRRIIMPNLKMKKDCKKCDHKPSKIMWQANGDLLIVSTLKKGFPCSKSSNSEYKRTFMDFVEKRKYEESKHGLNPAAIAAL